MSARLERTLAVMLVSATLACIPSPNGECSQDADCASGASGSFCADNICQGPTLAMLAVPSAAYSRSQSVPIAISLQRIHGGVASVSAVLQANGVTVAGTQLSDSDSGLVLTAPLSFAPANQEGPVSFAVIVTDDLGHALSLSGSVLVDDLGPRIAVAASSIPSAPVVRGAQVPLSVVLTDEAAKTLQISVGASAPQPASMQPDGTFQAIVNTSLAPPAASTVVATLLAQDALGNASQQMVSLPITRLRWRAPSPIVDQITGVALTATSVLATTHAGEFVVVDRASGARSQLSLNSGAPSGNLALDDAAAYTAFSDGRVCKLGFDGSILWCCDSIGSLAGSIALGPMPPAQSGGAPVSTVIATSMDSPGRFFAMRETAGPFCESKASPPIASFLGRSPAIALDGNVYSGAAEAIAIGRFDGLSWTSETFATAFDPVGQLAFAGSGRPIFSSEVGQAEELAFPAVTDGGLPGAPSGAFATQAAVYGNDVSSAAILEDGTAVVSTTDFSLVAIYPDGGIAWNTPLAKLASGSPVAGAGGVIYSEGNDGVLTAFSLDGGTLWSFSAGASIVGPVSPGCDGALYFGTSAGEIISLAADAPGLANSPWPREGHDVRGTGDARRPLRAADGGCVE